MFVDSMAFMRSLAAVRTELAEYAAGFDAGPLTATDADAVVREATAIINLAAGVRMVAATRVAQSGAWRHRGHRSAAEWLASVTKCSVAEAIAVLETAENLVDCPGVEVKVRSGELTGQQAHAISKAVVADPSSESKLLETAKTDGLSKLKQSCRSVEHAANGANDEGPSRQDPPKPVRCGTGQTTTAPSVWTADSPSTWAPRCWVRWLRSEAGAFDQARLEGRNESSDAYRADALEALADASLAGTDELRRRPRRR